MNCISVRGESVVSIDFYAIHNVTQVTRAKESVKHPKGELRCSSGFFEDLQGDATKKQRRMEGL